MTLEQLDLSQTHLFSPLFLDYLTEQDALCDFYHRFPRPENFREQMQEKSLSPAQRETLVKVLEEQYSSLSVPEAVAQNIQKLREENTYTLTTGHQLNIFSGPLYFIYKIVTAINTCRQLQDTYPDQHFVPVYWMASEDHDFEEIRHFYLFGNTYRWDTDQQGAVGRFRPDGLADVLEALPETVDLFEKAYREHDTLAGATRYFVNELFGEEGLVVLDADHVELKKSFQFVMEDDILHHRAQQLVEETSQRLEKMDYKTQVFPRPINFFYLDDQLRERLLAEDGEYKINNTDRVFSQEEILQAVQKHPERFSPNVVLRPLYQEVILPNLAYIGGPGEVAYWLQLKPVFDHYQVPFPILMPRNFALVLNKSNAKKRKKIDIGTANLFLDTQTLIKQYVEENAEASMSLEEEKKALAQVYEQVKEKVLAIDGSLEGFIGAEANKSFKSLANVEKRMKKAEEQNQETTVNQLESLKEKLFPEGELQERKENFLNYYINNPQFIKELLTHFDPFHFKFNILSE